MFEDFKLCFGLLLLTLIFFLGKLVGLVFGKIGLLFVFLLEMV